MLSCDKCGRKRPKKAKGEWRCLCSTPRDLSKARDDVREGKVSLDDGPLIESKGPAGPSLARPPHSASLITGDPTRHNHWDVLHGYALKERDTWDKPKAERFVRQWLREIPNYGCSCKDNFQPILKELPPVCDTPEQFLHRSWQWHDAVSAKLGKPRITWTDCQASWWGKVTPTRLNLLITVATGKCLAELEIVRPSLQAYADKINADFIALVNTTEPWWGYEKFRVQHFVPQYERTLFVDSDVVISPDCENLFDIVPESHVGIHDDWKHLPSHEWMQHEKAKVCESQGWTPDQREICLNTGVVVCSRHHLVWDRPGDGLPTNIHCAEQFAFEQQMLRQGVEWCGLDVKYNTQWWMPQYRKLVPHARINHLANSNDKTGDLKNAMKGLRF